MVLGSRDKLRTPSGKLVSIASVLSRHCRETYKEERREGRPNETELGQTELRRNFRTEIVENCLGVAYYILPIMVRGNVANSISPSLLLALLLP